MALISCPSCGKPLSDRAYKCPHCGYMQINHNKESVEDTPIDDNFKFGLKVFIYIITIILIIICVFAAFL